MPQLIAFPHLPEGAPEDAVAKLVTLCRQLPPDGEPFKAFRARLRELDLWNRDRLGGLQAFLRLEGGDPVQPSELVAAIAAADQADALSALAERLWHANPVLFKTIVERLADRVSPPGELYSYLDSFAYRGTPVPRAELESWVHLARGLGILKRIGIALGVGDRAAVFVDRAQKLDIEEFLEDDEPESIGVALGDGAGAADEAAPALDTAAPVAIARASTAPNPIGAASAGARLSSPIGTGAPVPVARFSGSAAFGADVLGETAARLDGWWQQQEEPPTGYALEDFGIDTEAWMSGSEEALYRIAVAAAFAFRLDADRTTVQSVFRALDRANVLADLYYGTAPEVLPDGVDSKALMLASLVARRCAEAPDLAATLEKQETAAAAFEALDASLGRGLFKIELFWIMGRLRDLGALRFEDLDDYAALPTRLVRDTLFRLGFIETPYAADANTLAVAAAAARRATGPAPAPHEVLVGFAIAAGCAYDCPNRRGCDIACRERAE